MNEIIQDLEDHIKEYQKSKKTGSVAVRVNFFKGGIGNYNLSKEESKKIKNDTSNKNNLKNKNNA